MKCSEDTVIVVTGDCIARRGGSSQHLLQAFCLLHPGVRTDRQEGVSAAAGVDRQVNHRGAKRVRGGDIDTQRERILDRYYAFLVYTQFLYYLVKKIQL